METAMLTYVLLLILCGTVLTAVIRDNNSAETDKTKMAYIDEEHQKSADSGERKDDHHSKGDHSGEHDITDDHQGSAGGKAEDDSEDDEEHSHFVTHILDQIEKGHITHGQVVRWYNDLKTGLERGTVTEAEYTYLMNTLATKAAGMVTDEDHHDEVLCCPFGK